MALQRPPVVTVLTRVQGLVSALAKHMDHVSDNEELGAIEVQASDFTTSKEWKPSSQQLERLQRSDVLLADPDLLVPIAYDIPNTKWVQATWAGVDAFTKSLDTKKPLPTFVITRAAYYGSIMAEFVFGQIIAQERNFLQIWDDQKKKRWRNKTWGQYRPLSTMSLGILGVGQIGNEIARIGKAHEMTVWGMIRTPPSADRKTFVDNYVTPDQLPKLLESCDYICSVLPSTPETIGLLSGETLKSCKTKRPCFINIGRGNVIDECSLLRALEEGWISRAVLDVTSPEPLPEDSALWDTPDVVITPHVSATTSVEHMASFFMNNYSKFVAGQPMNYVYDWERGY